MGYGKQLQGRFHGGRRVYAAYKFYEGFGGFRVPLSFKHSFKASVRLLQWIERSGL